MEGQKKRIAIIGGGLSGIGSIVAIKEEGLEPVCFEARDTYGGTWHYREESEVGYASIMPTTVLNHSKEMSAASNFPPKKEYNNFMHHKEAYQYCTEYYKRNECERYMRFNSEVTKVAKAKDYQETGRFLVTVKDKISGEESTQIFDGVMVCTGHFTKPNMVKFPGLDKFKGKVIHTHSFKTPDKFSGQKVLVVGSACSALDAVEVLTSVTKQVYLSARSGMYVLSRVGPSGYPVDYLLLRRYIDVFFQYLPRSFCNWYLETFYMDTKFDHRLYNVEPKYHFLEKDPVLNDAIASKLHTGSVVLKGSVKYFTENGVVFDGEETVTEIDAVVLGTGYIWQFPFLEEGLLETENGRINLYKCMYPTQLTHASLVFIGFVNPIGPGIPIGELQCRWAAHIFAGKGNLPSQKEMLKDAIERHNANKIRFAPSEYTSIHIDYIRYLDDIASQIGVKPNLLKYIFTDFPLFMKLAFGPSLPYQYRLEGSHKWEGAREAIMTSRDRVFWPLTRGKHTEKDVWQLIYEFIGHSVPRNVFI